MNDVTRILSQLNAGDSKASDALLPLVYEELRKLATSKMAGEAAAHTLQPTALVHEAYLRLVNDEVQSWDSRGHFFASAAEAMRRILVECARRKNRIKHGGDRRREAWHDLGKLPLPMPNDQLLALDEALTRLEQEDPISAELVKLRFFAGFSMPQIAQAMDKPLRSLERQWTYARSWLHRELSADSP